MNDTSFLPKFVFSLGTVHIKSTLDIQSLGKLISNKLFKGVEFGGLEDYIYDEVPAIYTKDILGCRFIIQRLVDDDEYHNEIILTNKLGSELGVKSEYLLEIENRHEAFLATDSIKADLSSNLFALLQDIEGLTVSFVE